MYTLQCTRYAVPTGTWSLMLSLPKERETERRIWDVSVVSDVFDVGSQLGMLKVTQIIELASVERQNQRSKGIIINNNNDDDDHYS